MALVQDLLDRLKQLQSDRQPWEAHWYDVARYALPDAERFDGMFAAKDKHSAIDSVVSEPIASRRTREIYDMTSLWAIDRGASGTLSLVMPQHGTWHDLEADDPFAPDPNDEDKRWYEQVRDYLFTTRANPKSGFWTANKASVRATWAFGTGVFYTEESSRGVDSPISYRYVPLSECHLGCDFEGNVNTNFRLFGRSAKQCVGRWPGKMSGKVQKMAEDPKQCDKIVTILHAVYPRNGETGGYGNTNRDSRFSSCYVEVDEKHLIGESGFYEFPYVVYHWQRNNPGPYSEGPISLALADIKMLNLMSKNEAIATQQWVRPPMASHDDGMPRVNLNSGAVNPGYVNAQGQLLVQPIISAQRPDFAQAILEAKRNQIKGMLYLDLWQVLVSERPGETATAAMIRAQEKTELLGPVGSSLQHGLSFLVDREIAILVRRGAFEPGAKLAAPESIQGRGISPRFTSPIDRGRRLSEYQAMQEIAVFAGELAKAGKVEALEKLDAAEMIDQAQEILGAPRSIIVSDDVLEQRQQQRQMAEMTARGTEATRAAGEAATTAAEGAQAVADNPAAGEVMKRVAEASGIPV